MVQEFQPGELRYALELLTPLSFFSLTNLIGGFYGLDATIKFFLKRFFSDEHFAKTNFPPVTCLVTRINKRINPDSA